jgi:iron complex outermembrane receptor protein
MGFRAGQLVALLVLAFGCLSAAADIPPAAGQSPGSDGTATGSPAKDNPPSPAPSPSSAPSNSPSQPASNSGQVDDLLNLNMDQLSKVRIDPAVQPANSSSPSNQITPADIDFSNAATTGELARQAPSVSTRRTSAVNLDPRVRGYNSGELNASANGMSEVKTRLDIDSALSQIDPGIVQDITVIDGPYTSLYGPGFAFLAVDLLPAPRYQGGPEMHDETTFLYGSNAQAIYTRENVFGGGKDWGVCVSYGLRTGNDYVTGGSHPEVVPSRYQKWDNLFSVSKDVSPTGRVEFDYVRCEMNGVELPGVVYDLENSTNNQFNLRYIVQEDPKGPKQLQLQAWYQQTDYRGDAAGLSKQQSLYFQFFTLPASTQGDFPVNTVGQGDSDSLGVRLLRTFGGADAAQLTVGSDWRRNEQFYREENLNAAGQIVLSGGDVYGIPESHLDDYGLLTDLHIPCSDQISFNVGGRLDYCQAALDVNDPVVTQFTDPTQYYYTPGFNEPHDVLGMTYFASKTKLTDQCTCNAGVAYAMRMPDLAELYSDDPFVPIARFGNSYISGSSNLSPEQDLQIDLGVSVEKKKISYGVRGFYAMIWDYIEPAPAFIDPSAPPALATHYLGRNFQYFPDAWRTDLGTAAMNADTNQAGYQYVNESFVTITGGDLFTEVKLSDWLSVYGDMAYVYGTNWNPVAFVSAPSWSAADGMKVPLGHSEGLPYMYPFTTTVAIRVYAPETQKWLVEFSARIVGAQNHVASSIDEIGSPGFAVFALRGRYKVNEHLRLTLALENLFNQPYTEPDSLAIINPQGIPAFVQEPGFSALLGVDARY